MYDSLVVKFQEPAVVRRFASILILLLVAPLSIYAGTIVEPASACLEINFSPVIFRGRVLEIVIDPPKPVPPPEPAEDSRL